MSTYPAQVSYPAQGLFFSLSIYLNPTRFRINTDNLKHLTRTPWETENTSSTRLPCLWFSTRFIHERWSAATCASQETPQQGLHTSHFVNNWKIDCSTFPQKFPVQFWNSVNVTMLMTVTMFMRFLSFSFCKSYFLAHTGIVYILYNHGINI